MQSVLHDVSGTYQQEAKAKTKSHKGTAHEDRQQRACPHQASLLHARVMHQHSCRLFQDRIIMLRNCLLLPGFSSLLLPHLRQLVLEDLLLCLVDANSGGVV